MKKIIGIILTLAGMVTFLTVSENPENPDSFKHVVIAYIIGLVMFATGAILADLFDKKENDEKPAVVETEGFSKQDDHNPYPEE